MTWNVQNLLPVGTKDGPPTQAALDAKLASLAQVIDTQQPDVLALQEIGPPQMLEQLQQRLTHKLPHLEISEHPDRHQIRVAFLSRLPLQDPVQLHPFPQGLAPVQVGDPPPGSTAPPPTLDHMGRGGLQFTVTADGQDLMTITAHLKSKLLTFPNDRFQPHDEDERPLRRLRAGPARRRGRHPARPPHRAAARPRHQSAGAAVRRPQRRGGGGHHPTAARPARLGA
jgi:hypothetical protein